MKYKKLSVANQTVEIEISKKDFQIAPALLKQTIDDAGKTLRGITVHWKGTFVKENTGYKLKIVDSGQSIPVKIKNQENKQLPSGVVAFVGWIEITDQVKNDNFVMEVSEILR